MQFQNMLYERILVHDKNELRDGGIHIALDASMSDYRSYVPKSRRLTEAADYVVIHTGLHVALVKARGKNGFKDIPSETFGRILALVQKNELEPIDMSNFSMLDCEELFDNKTLKAPPAL